MKTFTNKFNFLFLFLYSVCIADGNTENFEQGTSIYRDLTAVAAAALGQHWHAGLFHYFEYDQNTNKGKLRYSEILGNALGWQTYEGTRKFDNEIVLDDLSNSLNSLKYKLIDYFDTDENTDYNGAYSRIIEPNTLSDIVGTAENIIADGDDHGYTWQDMIDAENHWQSWPPGWYENWDGTIGK